MVNVLYQILLVIRVVHVIHFSQDPNFTPDPRVKIPETVSVLFELGCSRLCPLSVIMQC